jgi:hypothetical protein
MLTSVISISFGSQSLLRMTAPRCRAIASDRHPAERDAAILAAFRFLCNCDIGQVADQDVLQEPTLPSV